MIPGQANGLIYNATQQPSHISHAWIATVVTLILFIVLEFIVWRINSDRK